MTSVELPRRFDGGPEADDLRRWVSEGLTDTEIGELVGRLTNQAPASKQAVAYWRRKHHVERPSRRSQPTLDHSEVRPWRVKAEHVGDAIEHRLYDFSRRRLGRKLPRADERRLDEFLAFLDKQGWVIDYNPDTPNGWLFRVRDPEIDDPDNIIRAPG